MLTGDLHLFWYLVSWFITAEVARRQLERKRSRRRWLWSFMGLSIAIGASLAAYSYIPHTSEWSSLKSGDSTDASSISGSEISQGY